MTWLALGAAGVTPLVFLATTGEEALWQKALDWGLGFGLAALFLRLFVTGVIRRGADVDAERARADAAEERYARLMEAYMGELAPAMLKLTMESQQFSATSARNAELMERLINAVLSGMTRE